MNALPMDARIFLGQLPADRDALEARVWTRAERSKFQRLNLWPLGREVGAPHIERLLLVVGGGFAAQQAGDALLRMPLRFDDAVRLGCMSWGDGSFIPWVAVGSKEPTALDVLALRAVRVGGGVDLRSPLLAHPHRPADISATWPGAGAAWPTYIRVEPS